MRSSSRMFAVLSIAALGACSGEAAETFNPVSPSTTQARVRVINATNTTYELSSPAGEFLAINANIRHGASRCFLLDPNTAPLVRDSATKTLLTGLPATFAAGSNNAIVIYRATTTATTNSYFTYPVEGEFATKTDSGAIRVLNLSPNAGGVDVYVNIPNTTAVPPLNAANKVATNVPIGTAMTYLNVKGGVSYQVRITRTGSTTSANTLIDATQTALTGETVTIVLGIPSLTASTTFRSFSAGGC